jgi:hypothetical protein
MAREVYQAIIGGTPFEVAPSRAAGLDKNDSRVDAGAVGFDVHHV